MECQLIPVISIVAKSGTGKTTLLEKIIPKLKQDGIRLAVIKHDAHQFTMDQPGKDTWRLAEAGADVVAISSPHKMAMIEKVTAEKSLDEMISMISGVDLILTEGFKHGDKPKIEVFRSAVHQTLLSRPEELLAIASDIDWQVGVPCYPLDDITGITSIIKQYMENFSTGH